MVTVCHSSLPFKPIKLFLCSYGWKISNKILWLALMSDFLGISQHSHKENVEVL